MRMFVIDRDSRTDFDVPDICSSGSPHSKDDEWMKISLGNIKLKAVNQA